jgi:hypothetical protein
MTRSNVSHLRKDFSVVLSHIMVAHKRQSASRLFLALAGRQQVIAERCSLLPPARPMLEPIPEEEGGGVVARKQQPQRKRRRVDQHGVLNQDAYLQSLPCAAQYECSESSGSSSSE